MRSRTPRKYHAVSSEEMSQPAGLLGSINTQAKKVVALLEDGALHLERAHLAAPTRVGISSITP